jgi:hypothetical protein
MTHDALKRLGVFVVDDLVIHVPDDPFTMEEAAVVIDTDGKRVKVRFDSHPAPHSELFEEWVAPKRLRHNHSMTSSFRVGDRVLLSEDDALEQPGVVIVIQRDRIKVRLDGGTDATASLFDVWTTSYRLRHATDAQYEEAKRQLHDSIVGKDFTFEEDE